MRETYFFYWDAIVQRAYYSNENIGLLIVRLL